MLASMFFKIKICCDYSLVASRRDASNEPHNHCIHVKMNEISPFFGRTEPTFSRVNGLQHNKFEPRHEISTNVVCGTSKASDQPAHSRSLIRAFASRLNIIRVLSY